jgi:hypothetical protein
MSDYLARLDAALTDLVDAAIEADMYERDYWAQEGAEVFHNYALYKKIVRGNPGANDLGDDEGDTTDYEAEVFNFWPGQIEQIFDVWRSIPDPDDFEEDVTHLVGLAGRNAIEPKIEPPKSLLTGEFPAFPSNEFGADLKLVTDRSGDLYGRWAEAFHDEYVLALPWVLGNQQALIAILAAGVSSEKEIWRRAQEGVLSAASAGATWFRSIKNTVTAAETVFAVGKALNDGFNAVKDGISYNPFDIVEAVGDLGGAGADLKGAIEDSDSSGGGAGHEWGSSGSVYTAIAQSLEYTLNKQIVESETTLQDVLDSGVSALESSPDTFIMGDNHLANIRNGAAVLDRGEVNMHKSTVIRLVEAMRRVGGSVGDVGGDIDTTSMSWIRPGSIGLGAEGPYPALVALENAIRNAFYDTAQNLKHVATAVELAAAYQFATDENAQAELKKLNVELDRAQDRWDRQPDDPTQHGVDPYVIPPGELYVDQEDCLPEDDPLLQEQPPGPLQPTQP